VVEKLMGNTLKRRTDDVIDMRRSVSSVVCHIVEDIVDVVVVSIEK
jgi:hypothetical protein